MLAINWEFRTVIFHSRSKESKINFCGRGLTDVISLNKWLAMVAGQSLFISAALVVSIAISGEREAESAPLSSVVSVFVML